MTAKRLSVLLSTLVLCLFCLPALAASTIALPAGLTEITAEAFLNTQAADTILIPDGVTSVGARAFASSGVKCIVLPDTISFIAENAFEDTALECAICSEDSYAAAYFSAMGVPCQSPFPAKSFVTAICPWGAGGGTDAILRAFCMAMEPYLNDTGVIVDNVTGNGGINGHQAIADAETSGHTFGMVTFELSTYAALGTSTLTYADYDPLCLINTDAAAITVNAEWAAGKNIVTLADFIAYCKNHPGEVRLGGASNGSVWHIAGGYLMEQTGTDVAMVTYATGAADAIKAAAMGEIQGVTVSAGEARAFIESGHLLCLGVMDTNRSLLLPDVPTCAEAGYDLCFGTFRGLALPKGVSGYARGILEAACEAAAKDSAYTAFMNNNGQPISYLNSSDFAAYLEKHNKAVTGAMEILGLTGSQEPEPEPEPGELVDYPHRFVSMINPWAAGGGTDAILRAFSMAMENQMMDTTITVDNITGAGGINGHQAIADADTDGSEMGMITFELSTYAPLDTANLTYADYDPVCLINTDAAAVIVNSAWAAANGISNLLDFIAYCEENPRAARIGCASTGSVWHIACGYLMDQTGVLVQPMNYAYGVADAVHAAAMGEIQGVTVPLNEARAFIESGHLTCLGVMDVKPNDQFQDIPTCEMAGYNLVFGTFRGIALPKGVDVQTRALLERVCKAAFWDADFTDFMTKNGLALTYLGSNDFAAYLEQHAKGITGAMEILGLL